MFLHSIRLRAFTTGAVVLCACVPVCTAGAQGDASSASSAVTVRPWLVGVGVEGLEPLRTRIDGSRFRTGIAAQIGYERSLARTPFGVRVDASYVHRPRGDGHDVDALGAGLAGTYALASGDVRPYLLAGVGATAVTGTIRGSASAGIGTLLHVGRSWVFAEARLIAFPAFGTPSGERPLGLLPVTLGLRF